MNFGSSQFIGVGVRVLKKWYWWATASRLGAMRDFAWMLRRHQDDILNYFDLCIDNGAAERTKRLAVGVRF